MNNTPSNFTDQIDLVKVLWAAVAFLFLRNLKTIDKSLSLIFKKHEALEEDHNKLVKEFSELKGEHKVFTKNGAYREVK